MFAIKSIMTAALIAVAIPLAASAEETPMSTAQDKEKIEQIVREYLLKNPEVIVDAIKVFQQRQQAVANIEQNAALATFAEDLKNNPNDPVIGNPNGDVTVVEFFDYRCGYCKKVFPDVQKLLSDDTGIRYVLKEFPILGPQSTYASRAAQAVWIHQQDKYQAFHIAMMNNRGALSADKVMKYAATVGIDTEALKIQIEDPLVTATLEATAQQAKAMKINGTPAFIFGDALAPGAISLAEMKDMVRAARKP